MKVLIVEDELMVADIVEEVLVSDGFEVCGIARGIQEALAIAQRHNPDLAIVDVQLIDGVGTDLAPILIQQHQTRVIYTTANAEAVLDAMGHACLRKPFRLSLIKQAIDVTLQRSHAEMPIPIVIGDPVY